MRFELQATDPSGARAGLMHLAHGTVETPVFMPVGTQASVKAATSDELVDLGTQIILGNAYHLYLRPGTETIERAGGLHGFMGWDRPILTDSGGFQIFSLSSLNKITEDGFAFQSHLDGSKHFISPEDAVEIQRAIGSDIMMCLDECTDHPVSHEDAAKSMHMTLRWADRCKRAWHQIDTERQALFGIVQGSVYDDLRTESADATVGLDFPGYAIGGVSVGESNEQMLHAVETVAPRLPADKPRYLMGVGPPDDFLDAVERGIDMMDCVMPTRNARNGSLFTARGQINIRNARYKEDFDPLDPLRPTRVSSRYTPAYLSHLFRAGEITALRLNTLHNLQFMLDLAADCRRAIFEGRFTEFKRTFLAEYHGTPRPA